jgi:hypothetical protein
MAEYLRALQDQADAERELEAIRADMREAGIL